MTILFVAGALLAGWLVMRGLESDTQPVEELERQSHGNLLALVALVAVVLVGVALIGVGV